ncbi:MAG: hypothetical protein U9N45_07015, partial [Gemmatimonadota bacterium]|nr:hypothetical protein [Gemmatimonadota bacterium]
MSLCKENTARRILPALIFCLVSIPMASPLLGQNTWFASYEQALEHISVGRWDEAVSCLKRAAALKPEPELNARTYGVWRKDYLPYYQLGLAH